MSLAFSKRDSIIVDNKNVDWIPVRKGQVERLLTSLNSEPIINYADLKDFFKDKEDGNNLEFSILENTNPGVVNAVLDGSKLNLSFINGASGQVTLTFLARDSAGNTTSSNMEILVLDPDKGNIALFKPVIPSSIENEGNAAELVNDGSLNTRFSTLYENNQSLTVNLDGLFTINKVLINWEAAYGLEYDFQVSIDGENWDSIFTETNGKEGLLEYNFNNINAKWARLLLNKRGTEWGFSIWELEIIGERVK